MKKIFLFLAGFLFALPAFAVTNTSSAQVKVFNTWFSTSGTCASPTKVFTSASGTTVDFNDSTNSIGTASTDDGTYLCVVFEISDQVTFTPSANDGANCVGGTAYTIDVCKNNGSGAPSYKHPETGVETQCAAASGTEDRVFVYVSTFAATTSGGQATQAFFPPTSDGDTTNGMKLNNSIVINGSATGTFKFGTVGKVDGGSFSSCDMNPPDFGFSVL